MSCQREGGEIYGLATHGAGRVLSHPIAYTVFAEGMSARQDTVRRTAAKANRAFELWLRLRLGRSG